MFPSLPLPRTQRRQACAAPPPSPRSDAVFSPQGVHLPGDLGRRFARLVQDYNPIHVSAPTAWLFGFKATVAHGMCVVGRVLPTVLGDGASTRCAALSPRIPALGCC